MECGSKPILSLTARWVTDLFVRSDNNEFFTRDDGLLCKNEFDHKRETGLQEKINMGLMGRIMGNEIMNMVR